MFPGIGMLDAAFEEKGFCVVRGPDVLWGGDIRRFNPPAGRFDGMIGGPPCQAFSRLAHMVRHNGYEPKFGNLIPEFERCVREAEPQWFVMENVPDAPVPEVDGYGVHSFFLNNRQLGEKQNRVRRWSFGWRGVRRVLKVAIEVFENPEYEYAACGGSGGCARPIPIRLNSDGRPKGTLARCSGGNIKSVRSFDHIRTIQGLPDDFDLPGFTVAAKCKAVGNGVPMAMGRAIAEAVLRAVQERT
jgi:DNA (cytosine-5)-methyltransferase 1